MSAVKKKAYESDSDESSADSEENLEGDLSDQSDENKDEVQQSPSQTHATKEEENKNIDDKHQSVTFVCNALSDFIPKEAGELAFEKDEMLTIIGVRKDGWWEAKNNDGIQGLVPSTFLKVPDHVNTLINEMLQSSDTKETHFWTNLRSSIRKARALNTAIRTFGSIGLPLGFRESFLSALLNQDKNYSAEAFLTPKLSESGLSFEDIHWEILPTSANKMALQMKPVTTVLQKVIQLVALRQIIPPPSGLI